MQKNYPVGKFQLDDFQMELLRNDENTIVIAGAGSGKTLTIIGKINFLIKECQINPKNILIISFTNASVNDIKLKIEYDVDVFTFHKLAMSILEHVNYSYSIAPTNMLKYLIEEKIKSCDKNEQKLILKFLNLNINFKRFLKTKEYESFCNLIETFINLWKTNNLSLEDLPFSKYTEIEKKILVFIFNIYKKYNIEKNSVMSLDFDDLIYKATEVTKIANLTYQYIIIDEFQDSSFIRLNLIREIFKYTRAKIIVVGDDWQSIYRFSGCDLNLFINFPTYFPNVKTIKLKNTYRNSQQLISVASIFVTKNPYQIKKELLSNKTNPMPLIFVPYKNKVYNFKKLLNELFKKSEDIMVLSRNNKDIYNYIDKEFQLEFPLVHYNNHTFKYLTIHKSKGLEGEYVIVLNCDNTSLGLPNKIENSPLINKLFQDNEIKYAEERRLFYVAITRCKEETYLVYDKSNPSIFIKEIKKITKKKLGKIKYFK